MKRLIFFVVFMTLATLGLIQLVVTQPSQEEDHGADIPTQQPANVMSMTEVSVTLHKGERVSWRLWAKSAQLREGEETSRLDQVRFAVYTGESEADTEAVLKGEARTARIRGGADGWLSLERDVVLSQGARLKLRTQRLTYDAAREELVAPGPVEVTTPQGEHFGDALRYNIGEEQLIFTHPRFTR